VSTSAANTAPHAADAPYRRGYRNPADLRDVIARAHTTRLGRTVTLAVLDHLSVVAVLLAATSPAVRGLGAWAVAVAVPVAVLVAARQLRALECLVHEASHFNWSRHHRRAADALATVLACLPTGARIADYRASHLLHHGKFGTAADPDRQRYTELGLEDLDRTRATAFAAGLARRFVPYQLGWFATLGAAPVTAALPLLWSAALIVAPAALAGGAAWAVPAALVWLVTHVVALPALRFVGESSEHVYREADTVFDATVSNLGLVQRVLIHPHGDGYHTVHHLWPGVPHHRLRWLHHVLLAQDPAYRERLKYRTGVLQRPRTGALARP
jgi:fatty acid desaturase